MRKTLISFFLNYFSLPVLGSPVKLPSDWLYGGSGAKYEVEENSHSNPTIDLTFKEESSVNADRIYLADVAECRGSLEVCRKVSTVELNKSPKPGSETRYLSSSAASVVETEFSQYKFKYSGAKAILIKAIGIPVNIEEIKLSLTSEWNKLNHSPVKFELIELKGPKFLNLRNAPYVFKFPDLSFVWERLKQTPRRTSIMLQVDATLALESGAETISFPIQVFVRSKVFAAVVEHDLEKGFLINRNDFRMDWVPFQERLVTSESELNGKTLRSSIKAGSPFKIYELSREPDIKRGERVDASIRRGGIKMAGSGQALESGIIGQKIRVQLETSKRQVFGTIVAKSQIEVDLP